MKRHWPTWTPDEINTLRAMKAAGKTAATIAAALGRTLAAVQVRASDMGIKRAGFRQWTSTEINTLRAMKAAGKRADEIAEALGRSVSAVNLRAYDSGIYKRGRRPQRASKNEREAVSAIAAKNVIDRLNTVSQETARTAPPFGPRGDTHNKRRRGGPRDGE